MKHHVFKGIKVLVVIVLLWEVSSILFQREFLPGAGASIYSLIELTLDGTLLPHLWASAYRIVIGTMLGLLVSIPVGLLMGGNEKVDQYLGTAFNVLYPIPKVVFLPIFVVIMGVGDAPKIFLIALVLFFQLTVVIRDAAKNIPDDIEQVMQSLSANRFQNMIHLVFPACMPEIITSLRSSLGVSTAMLFITENFASFRGLGYYITRCMDSRDYENMYAGILMLGILGVGLYGAIGLVERKVCKWKMIETISRNEQTIQEREMSNEEYEQYV